MAHLKNLDPKRTRCQFCGVKCKNPKSRAAHERFKKCDFVEEIVEEQIRDISTARKVKTVKVMSIEDSMELSTDALMKAAEYLEQLITIAKSKLETIRAALDIV